MERQKKNTKISNSVASENKLSSESARFESKKKQKQREVNKKEDSDFSEIELEEEIDVDAKDKQDIGVHEDDTKPQESFFSGRKFEELKLSNETLHSLNENNFINCTEIQEKCIPIALTGADIMGAAKTGSGKSLSFLIPAVELLAATNFKQINGTGVIVLTPTRELALQLFNLAKDLLSHHKNKTCAILMGGANRKVEAEKLKKGVNLIVATPGRLLDHLKSTKGFNFSMLSMLIIDEADAILKIGFEDELRQILQILPKERQTLLFSATLTKKIENLITLSLREPIFIKAGKESKEATVATLEQGYVVVEPDKKFMLLYTFIRKNIDKKIMVFFSSCNAVKFYSYLLNYVDIPVSDIHGNQKQQKRTTTYFEFCNAEKGILLCTDVAQRGLDIPDVDWIIQYDPPHDPEEYLHRVGRTARGADSKGKALLILLKNELGILRLLLKYNIKINEFDFPESKLAKIQDQFESLVEKNYYLNTSANDAYKSYLHSYVSHKLREIYDINQLDLAKVCRSFGFTYPPYVNLNIKIDAQSKRKQKYRSEGLNKDKEYYSKGYDKVGQQDNRQFVH